MASDNDLFEPRLGRMRARGEGRGARRMRGQILERVARTGGNPRRSPGASSAVAAPRSGRFNARGRGAKLAAAFPRGSGWSFDHGIGMRVRPRRVAVKARVVKLAGKMSATTAHLRYLERDGVSREGEPGRFYSTFSDEADGKAFAERGSCDRHHFRLIVSPEDGAAFEDLRPFTRDLMAKMEKDLGTTLDWVAVDHHDTGHPHSHILIRGKCEDGKTLNIAGDYIAHGIRHRASEIMTRALGPQTEREVQDQLTREVDAERMTRLDRALIQRAHDGVVDLRLGTGDPAFQQLLVARARRLEDMELATREGPLVWSLDPNAERTLADMGRRGDIIRTMHQEMTRAGLDRRPELYVVRDPQQDQEAITGRVIRYGTSDEHHERRYVLIDGLDGRTHHADIGAAPDLVTVGSIVRLSPRGIDVRTSDRTIAEVAAANAGIYGIDEHLRHDRNATQTFAESHVRRLEAQRRAGGQIERRPDGRWIIPPDHLANVEALEKARTRKTPLIIETLSTEPIERLAHRNGPTLLDTELTAVSKLPVPHHGFGEEWRTALVRRQQWLIEQGLVSRDGEHLVPADDLIGKLRVRQMAAMGSQLSRELGLDYAETRTGDRVSGTLVRSIETGGNRYALIEKPREFTLVPWREVLERQLGKSVSGIMRDGGISWTFGRERGGPSIG